MDRESIRKTRLHHLGRSLSLAYRDPLHLVRGEGQFVYDDLGRQYLDLANNVCHVGHGHPRVVEAAHRQMAALNTNTQYLHEHIVHYAERLAATMPDPLSVCFFVNSASEANDLALRLVRAATGRRDMVVIDGADHGHLSSLVEISPHQFHASGGPGAPSHVSVVPAPDGYRGTYKGQGKEVGQRYARHVAESVAARKEQGGGVGGFICESILSGGGQVVLPEGYLQAAYWPVREARGYCIADEAQTGFGRVGHHFWAFRMQEVVPDIVTLGKGIGNGHPLGAVVTTPEIADAFSHGREYFNTFGGNPVSCAVGLAVLDVIEEEQLQGRAVSLGEQLMDGLRALQGRHPLIGDVRGLGLFMGVELVRDRVTLEPATEEASRVVEAMKDRGILLHVTGPLQNVLAIQPPMVVTEGDVSRVVETMEVVLGEVGG